jgi:hypothetical protein
MLKKILLAASLSVCSGFIYAQENKTEPENEGTLLSHYIGVQANQLFRQIINLNNNNTVIENPYLFIYRLHHNNTGWGLNFGMGYDYRQIKDKDSPGNRETHFNKQAIRIGAGKKYTLGKRLEAGFSLDLLLDRDISKTITTTVINFGGGTDSTDTENTTEIIGLGAGPQVNISFQVSKRLLIGTEASCYFKKSNNKEHIFITETITDQFSNSSATTSTNSNTEIETREFSFTVPVALFLIVKF